MERRELMDEIQNAINKLGFPILLSIMASLARFMFSDKKSMFTFLRGVIVSSFAGAIVAMALEDTSYGEGFRGAIVGVSAFCADEVLMVFILLAKNMKDDPVKYVRDYLRRK